MQIKTSSWHYRLIQFWQLGVPEGLCQYIRKVILAILLFPMSAVGFVFFAVLGAFTLMSMIVPIATEVSPLLFIFGWTVALCAAVHIGAYKRAQGTQGFWTRDLFKRNQGCVEPNIFIQYLKAKKEKVCPKVEYIDG